MNDRLSRSTAAYPGDVSVPDWVTVERQVAVAGSIVTQGVQIPQEIETVFMSHTLGIVTSHGNLHQITRIDDREYSGTFASGTGFLSPAGADYFSAWKSTDTGVNLTIDPVFLWQTAAQNSERFARNSIELKSIPLIQDPQITTIVFLFQREIETGGLGGQLYAESLRNLLIVHLLRHYCAFPFKPQYFSGCLSTTQLDRVLDYINTYLSQCIHLSTLSAIANMSEAHFSRAFKQSTGFSPHQYLLRRRIAKAKQLLSDPELNVLEVALACGFANGGHLSRHFKRLVGMTPKKFQQQ